jgi:hypothetical protein
MVEHGERRHVDRQRPLPGGPGHVEERFDHAVAGVVDEHVDPPEARRHRGDGSVGRAVAGKVAREVEHRLRRRGSLGQAGLRQVGDGDANAAGEELAGDLATHAATRSGDERGPLFSHVAHRVPLQRMRASLAVPVNSSIHVASQSDGKASGR